MNMESQTNASTPVFFVRFCGLIEIEFPCFIPLNRMCSFGKTKCTRLMVWIYGWMDGCLIDWLIDRLVGLLVGWLAGLTAWLPDWLTDWLAGWLADWLSSISTIQWLQITPFRSYPYLSRLRPSRQNRTVFLTPAKQHWIKWTHESHLSSVPWW